MRKVVSDTSPIPVAKVHKKASSKLPALVTEPAREYQVGQMFGTEIFDSKKYYQTARALEDSFLIVVNLECYDILVKD